MTPRSRILLAAIAIAARLAHGATDDAVRGAFVTTLGRDTVALERMVRDARRIEGDVVVRVPGTVLFHYVAERAPDGSLARTRLDVHPLGLAGLAERRVTLERAGDSMRVTVDSAGVRRQETRAVPRDAEAIFLTGFDDSYGLYDALGLFEFALAAHPWSRADTLTLATVNPATGRTRPRLFVRRAPTAVDADFFRIAWTHLALDAAGRIASADARGTTEQTTAERVAWLDVPRLAREFAERDRAGHGLGVASPNVIANASLDGGALVVTYGSPRLRGRHALGEVIPYDTVWRTGANGATVLHAAGPVVIGGTSLPAGAYSLWTVPHRDGSAELVINAEHGQWGTHHDAAQDLARVPLRVERAAAPREAFAISLPGTEQARTLELAWDTFVWRVPIARP